MQIKEEHTFTYTILSCICDFYSQLFDGRQNELKYYLVFSTCK